MSLLMFYFEKEELFPNVILNEGVERQVYDNRFGVLSSLPFPKFKTYDEYLGERTNA